LFAIQEISKLQQDNEKQLDMICADIKVLSSFLFILARARMHDKNICDAEVEATSSLGLAGIKQFKSFISDSIFKAETEAYDHLGLTLDAMRAHPQFLRQLLPEVHKDAGAPIKEDIYNIRARFRQLCFASIKELYSVNTQRVDYAQMMRDPFRRLRKPQLSLPKAVEVPKPSNSDTFTVATVQLLPLGVMLCVSNVFCSSTSSARRWT
jgi:hypothetical protein